MVPRDDDRLPAEFRPLLQQGARQVHDVLCGERGVHQDAVPLRKGPQQVHVAAAIHVLRHVPGEEPRRLWEPPLLPEDPGHVLAAEQALLGAQLRRRRMGVPRRALVTVACEDDVHVAAFDYGTRRWIFRSHGALFHFSRKRLRAQRGTVPEANELPPEGAQRHVW
eukprot:CAMPEP_0115186336 /NCGR_PEP_ID=MMETSP0270-20121206/9929_1 /TAXON_ID=71861 /ORGANISM="Scrippsiella trochoidea, Strain CCMP3099" /LENGTH=165 /DNA_ID=CAMNT_0002599457 /DNA_START=503 /DNA_END=997 /DNA_ORIENTATION=-